MKKTYKLHKAFLFFGVVALGFAANVSSFFGQHPDRDANVAAVAPMKMAPILKETATDFEPPRSQVKQNTAAIEAEPSETVITPIAKPTKKPLLSFLRKPATQSKSCVNHIDDNSISERLPSSEATPSEESISVAPRTPAEHPLAKDFWVWGGVGAALVSYSQNVPNMSDINFGKIEAPTQRIKAGFMFDDHWGVELSYSKISGEARSTTEVTIANGSYNWQTMSAELLYTPSKSEDLRESQWFVRAGLQNQELPLFIPQSANNITMQNSNLTTASVGVEYRRLTKKKLRLETSVRYQHQLSNTAGVDSSVKVKQKLAFDGSVGAAYEVKKNLFVGAYWSGQYNDGSLEYQTGGQQLSGTQTQVNSNLELRVGFEF